MIPIAIAIALSTVPIMITIVILLSPERSRAAMPFLIGWVAGILVVVSICALLAEAVPAPRSPRRPDTVIGTIEIIVGVALLAVAIISWIRASRSDVHSMPMGLGSKTKFSAWEALGLGFILNVRPKGILLAIAGGLTVRSDAETLPIAVVAILVYTAIGASTVAVPIIAVRVAPGRTEPILIRAQDWLVRHGNAITSVVLIVIALIIIAMGVQRL